MTITSIAGMNIPERRPVLIDAMNLVYRSHYAHRGLTTKTQVPTGLLYGFLRNTLRLQQAGRLIVCWDARGPRWRNALYPPYKANRKPDPEHEVIKRALPVLQEVLTDLGHLQLVIPTLEADDLISIAASKLKRVWVYSNDKDLYQVLASGVDILRHNANGGMRKVTAATVALEEGLTVQQWPMYLALGGDTSDNIRPIPGCGPATAKKILAAGANLEQLWNQQPRDLRQAFPQYEVYWPAVLAAYSVTKLPVRRLDQRLAGASWKTWTLKRPVKADRAERLKKFIAFCSEYELAEFITKRREFCP